jgi:hypothetical protein
MPRLNERRVAHKSTGEISPKIAMTVGPMGNAPNHLTTNTVAFSANESLSPGLIRLTRRNSLRAGFIRLCNGTREDHLPLHRMQDSAKFSVGTELSPMQWTSCSSLVNAPTSSTSPFMRPLHSPGVAPA